MTLTIAETNSDHTISGEFEDDEWETLRDYAAHAAQLAQTHLVQIGFPVSLTLSWDHDAGARYESQLPDSDTIGAFLHRLRPLTLNDERTSFYRVCGILAKRLDDEHFRAMLQPLRDVYSGKKMQSAVRISVDNLVLNSGRVLNDWLNAYEYHRDTDKRQFFEGIRDLLPQQGAAALFLMLLSDRTRAILGLAQVVRLILGELTQLTGLVLKSGAE